MINKNLTKIIKIKNINKKIIDIVKIKKYKN